MERPCLPPASLLLLLLLLLLRCPSTSAWCLAQGVCTVDSACSWLMQVNIAYLRVSIFPLVVTIVPLLYLIYQLWWKITAKFKQALLGTLAIERQMLPIYIPWLQTLMIFNVWVLLGLFLIPINSILANVIYITQIMGTSMLSNMLVFWMYMPDPSKRSLKLTVGLSSLISIVGVGSWYLTTNPGFEWQVVAGDWDFFRIILSGLWFVVYFSLFIVRYIPCLSQFSARRALSRFLFAMAAVWLITTVLTSLRYFHISEASCVSFTLSALTPPLFILVYVSALQADSIDLRKKGFAGKELARSPPTLFGLSDDWCINYAEMDVGIVLARGNFSEVRRGVWRGIDVAIKTLYQTHMKNTDLKVFEREVEILKQLHHPNIVLFVGACTQAPHFSIVMEFMPMGSLHQFVHSEEEISLHRKFLMGRDIARGMFYLHSLNPVIIHRDLKSLNVLVSDNLTLKITDFGLSSTKVNHTVTTVGTPIYSAPEVLRSSVYSEKSDVYSFAILMWELLVRKEPYQDFNLFEIIHRVIHEGLRPRLPSPSSEYPVLMLNIIQQCWAADPDNRPSFEQILAIMEEASHEPHPSNTTFTSINSSRLKELRIDAESWSGGSHGRSFATLVGSGEESGDGSVPPWEGTEIVERIELGRRVPPEQRHRDKWHGVGGEEKEPPEQRRIKTWSEGERITNHHDGVERREEVQVQREEPEGQRRDIEEGGEEEVGEEVSLIQLSRRLTVGGCQEKPSAHV